MESGHTFLNFFEGFISDGLDDFLGLKTLMVVYELIY